MKITFLTPSLELHGGNMVMLKHADYLVSRGHKITIVTTDKPAELSVNSQIKILKCHRFPIKWVDFFTYYLVYLYQISNLVEESDYIIPIYSPLIIHAIVAKKRKKLKAKIIPLFQDSFNTLWVGIYSKWLVRSKIIQRNIFKLIAVSKSIAQEYEKLSNKIAELVTNGVELDIFYPRRLPKKNYILFVGRPNKPKGYYIFEKTFLLLKKSFINLKAIVVSPNPKIDKKNGINFIKYKNREQLAKLYNQARVFVSASYAEGFSLPPLEAMASGTPVVMTKAGAEKEFAKNELNSLLVPVGDYKSLANSIKIVIKDKLFTKKLIQNGLKTAKRYSWKQSNQHLESFLLANQN